MMDHQRSGSLRWISGAAAASLVAVASAAAVIAGAGCGSGSDSGSNGSGGFGSSSGPNASSNQGDGTVQPAQEVDGSASSSGGNGAMSSTSSGSDGGGAAGGDASKGAQGAADASASSSSTDGSTGLLGLADGGSCPAPAGITAQQQTALQIVNQTRAAMGSPCSTMVPDLNTSATKHCQYYAANNTSSATMMMCDSNAHVEVSGCTDYVAAQFYDRETAAGYSCTPSLTQGCNSSEVMAFDDNPTYALGQWIGSIYHRTPLLDPWMRDFGYGNATMCDTIDLGEGAGSTTPTDLVVAYPYDGMTGVGTSFEGSQEIPTPPVPPNGWPSGMPVHVFMQATSITLTTDEFSVDGGAQLAHQVMTPQSAMGYLSDAVVLYGNSPLTSKTTYRVHVAGTRQNQTFSGTTSGQFDVNFTFTTM